MADNIQLNGGIGGALLAADEIAGVKHQRVKIQYGADGSATDVSTSSPLPVTNLLLEASKGNIPGHSVVVIRGHNGDVDTASVEDVWGEGGTKTYLSSAETLDIKSTDANDASAGTGMRTVRVYGLNASLAEITEDVVLNGTTDVVTSASFLRVTKIEGRTAGSGGTNAGAITADGSTSGNVLSYMAIGAGVSEDSHYTVPDSATLYLTDLEVFAAKTSTGSPVVDAKLMQRPIGESADAPWREIYRCQLDTGQCNQVSFKGMIAVSEQSDIKWVADVDVNNSVVRVVSTGILVG